jgi:hypothetical protein
MASAPDPLDIPGPMGRRCAPLRSAHLTFESMAQSGTFARARVARRMPCVPRNPATGECLSIFRPSTQLGSFRAGVRAKRRWNNPAHSGTSGHIPEHSGASRSVSSRMPTTPRSELCDGPDRSAGRAGNPGSRKAPPSACRIPRLQSLATPRATSLSQGNPSLREPSPHGPSNLPRGPGGVNYKLRKQWPETVRPPHRPPALLHHSSCNSKHTISRSFRQNTAPFATAGWHHSTGRCSAVFVGSRSLVRPTSS